jgi:hypothetical protein
MSYAPRDIRPEQDDASAGGFVAERNERHLVFRESGRGVGAYCNSIGRLHGAEQHGVVGHDQGGNVIDEDDDANAL